MARRAGCVSWAAEGVRTGGDDGAACMSSVPLRLLKGSACVRGAGAFEGCAAKGAVSTRAGRDEGCACLL